MPVKVLSGDVRELDAAELKSALQEAGITEIDTAARYQNGESEKKIGRTGLSHDFVIDTKVLFNPPGEDTLTPEAIEKSVSNSLQVLGLEKVNILYCHGPDLKTPVADQARALDEQYRKGRFSHLGVSNFPVSMIEEWFDIAEKSGYVKPSVYQGQYNLFSRGYEETLFPLLRKHDMGFRAYSPLAGGFLLGNFTKDGVQGGRRFTMDSPFMNWYNHPSMFEAVEQMLNISKKSGIAMDELSMRWLAHHSALGDKDGMILGASKPAQLVTNVAQISKGPLDADVAKQLDALWVIVRDDAMKHVLHDKYLMGLPRST